MLYLFYITVALAIIAIANALFPQEERVSIIKTRKTPALSKIFVVLFKPLSVINYSLLKLFPIINNNLRKGISFVKWDITPAVFLSSKEMVAVVVGVGSYFLISNLAIAWIFLAAGISFFIPDFILLWPSWQIIRPSKQFLRRHRSPTGSSATTGTITGP